jgi:lysozyme family protein
MADFEKAIQKVLRHEGGYVHHPRDPGGETNFGITDRLDGKVDGLIDVDGNGSGDITVKALREEQARVIYKREFWDKMRGDEIKNQQVAEIVFDAYVNMGPRALKLLQKEIGVEADGVFGPVTISILNLASPVVVFNQFKDARIYFYKDLVKRKPELKVFEKGWMNRINSFQWT